MKHIFTSICLGFVFICTASAQDRHRGDSENTAPSVRRSNARAQTATAPNQTTVRSVARPANTQRQLSTAPSRQRTYAERPRTNANANVRYHNTTTARGRHENARVTNRGRVESNVAVNRDRNVHVKPAKSVAVNRDRNVRANWERNVAVNQARNVRFNQRANVAVNRNRNVVVTNNWRGSQFSGRQYAAFRDYHQSWHDRDWWTHHYSRIIFVSGGWWYWNAGYWYPAWGYDPYAYYPYDGPIYGYANLTPDQVVSDVQAQLQRDGYYAGPIDGVLGPMTRQAIAAFQADNGLAITSTVDEPTLDTLGIS